LKNATGRSVSARRCQAPNARAHRRPLRRRRRFLHRLGAHAARSREAHVRLLLRPQRWSVERSIDRAL